MTRLLALLLLCALPLGAFAQSRTLTIANNNDDGEQDPFNNWTATNSTIYAGANPLINYIGLSFVLQDNIAATCEFTAAYPRLYSTDTDGSLAVNVGVENANPATNTIWSGTHLPSGALIVGTGTNIAATSYGNGNWYFGEGDTNAVNLAAALNTLLAATGPWSSGGRINIRFVGTSGSGYAGFQDSSGGSNDPQLALEWTCDSEEPQPPEITSVTPATFADEDAGIEISGENFSDEENTVLICEEDDPESMTCVQQTITSEGETSIVFTAVQGGLPSETTLYLFVANADGIANEGGYEVEFEEEPIVATKLIFGSQPGNIVVGQTFATFTVRAVDADDNLDEAFEENVTITLCMGDGALGGTTTRAAVAGVATFNDVFINTLNMDAVICADGGMLTQAQSDPFDVTAGGSSSVAYPPIRRY